MPIREPRIEACLDPAATAIALACVFSMCSLSSSCSESIPTPRRLVVAFHACSCHPCRPTSHLLPRSVRRGSFSRDMSSRCQVARHPQPLQLPYKSQTREPEISWPNLLLHYQPSQTPKSTKHMRRDRGVSDIGVPCWGPDYKGIGLL